MREKKIIIKKKKDNLPNPKGKQGWIPINGLYLSWDIYNHWSWLTMWLIRVFNI